jgi:hypothetical protein
MGVYLSDRLIQRNVLLVPNWRSYLRHAIRRSTQVSFNREAVTPFCCL